MAIQPQDLRKLICGTLKLVEPTDKRDSSKRVIWKAECTCGEFEYGAKPDLEKYAGHCDCPGHPFKGKELPVEGFKLNPDIRDSLDHAAAASDWELKRHPEQPVEERVSEPLDQDHQDAPETSEIPKDKDTSPKPSEVLQKRLGLSGYTTCSQVLTTKIELLGCKAEKVVFAKKIDGPPDLVLLHVQLVDAAGKRSIVSSKKKVSEAEWSALTAQLAEMKIDWREKDVKRKAQAA
jgi:hypothetical protein